MLRFLKSSVDIQSTLRTSRALFPQNQVHAFIQLQVYPKALYMVDLKVIDNNYASSKDVDNSTKTKQRTFVFDRIRPSTTRFSTFQRMSMTTKEEENQCPTSAYTQTSTFKKLSISTSKKN